MSLKPYKVGLPTSSQRISEARAKFEQMSELRKMGLMVEVGVMTNTQAEGAKRRLKG